MNSMNERDAFRAIHGLVAALSARCELLEPEARAEALSRVNAVTSAVDQLRQVDVHRPPEPLNPVEHLVDSKPSPASVKTAEDA